MWAISFQLWHHQFTVGKLSSWHQNKRAWLPSLMWKRPKNSPKFLKMLAGKSNTHWILMIVYIPQPMNINELIKYVYFWINMHGNDLSLRRRFRPRIDMIDTCDMGGDSVTWVTHTMYIWSADWSVLIVADGSWFPTSGLAGLHNVSRWMKYWPSWQRTHSISTANLLRYKIARPPWTGSGTTGTQ